MFFLNVKGRVRNISGDNCKNFAVVFCAISRFLPYKKGAKDGSNGIKLAPVNNYFFIKIQKKT